MSKKQDKKNKESLIHFMVNNSFLDELSKRAKEINLYKIFKIEKAEIRHSNMLAWLLDPDENHNIGDIFLREIIKCIFSNQMNYTEEDRKEHLMEEIVDWTIGDFENVHVEREARVSNKNKEREDIIVFAEKEGTKYLLAIENKIDSKESEDQTSKYRQQIEKTYSDHDKMLFVFLTPTREQAEDETWYILSYEDVVSSLKTVLQMENVSDKTRWIISDTVKTIESNIIGDETLTLLCDKIYDDYPDAIELLLKALKKHINGKDCYKDDEDINRMLKGIINQHLEAIMLLDNNKTDQGLLVAKCIREVLKETNESCNGALDLKDDLINKKAYIRFNTKKMTDLLGGELEQDDSPWKTKQKYYYEFNNRDGLVFFHLVFGGGSFLDKDTKERELKIANHFGARGNDDYQYKHCNITKEWKLDFSGTKEEDREEIKKCIKRIIDEIPKMEEEIEKVLTEE